MPKAYVTRTADVAELVISAPPLNLFDAQLAADLESALDEVIALCCPRGDEPESPPGSPREARPGAARAVLLRAKAPARPSSRAARALWGRYPGPVG